MLGFLKYVEACLLARGLLCALFARLRGRARVEEEIGLNGRIDNLLGMLDIPFFGQVQQILGHLDGRLPPQLITLKLSPLKPHETDRKGQPKQYLPPILIVPVTKRMLSDDGMRDHDDRFPQQVVHGVMGCFGCGVQLFDLHVSPCVVKVLAECLIVCDIGCVIRMELFEGVVQQLAKGSQLAFEVE